MNQKPAIKRVWKIFNMFIAARNELEAKKIYRAEMEPGARNLEVVKFDGPFMLREDEDSPEFETDEQGFVNMLECGGGYWVD